MQREIQGQHDISEEVNNNSNEKNYRHIHYIITITTLSTPIKFSFLISYPPNFIQQTVVNP